MMAEALNNSWCRAPLTIGEFKKLLGEVPDSATLEIIINNRQAIWPESVTVSHKHIFIQVKDNISVGK